jgi:hypothetical protein
MCSGKTFAPYGMKPGGPPPAVCKEGLLGGWETHNGWVQFPVNQNKYHQISSTINITHILSYTGMNLKHILIWIYIGCKFSHIRALGMWFPIWYKNLFPVGVAWPWPGVRAHGVGRPAIKSGPQKSHEPSGRPKPSQQLLCQCCGRGLRVHQQALRHVQGRCGRNSGFGHGKSHGIPICEVEAESISEKKTGSLPTRCVLFQTTVDIKLRLRMVLYKPFHLKRVMVHGFGICHMWFLSWGF